MSPLKFVKAVAETYFAEKDKAWRNSKRCWDFLFIGFFALYLFQIYAAYMDWQSIAIQYAINDWHWDWTNPDEIWQSKLSAVYLQGIVLFGVFIRFLSSQFRGKWFIRFGELGELIAFAAFFHHYQWTVDIQSKAFEGYACSSPGLLGMVPFSSQLLMLYFLGWVFCKVVLIIALTWITVRKYPPCPTRF